jgi:hypothetical protein
MRLLDRLTEEEQAAYWRYVQGHSDYDDMETLLEAMNNLIMEEERQDAKAVQPSRNAVPDISEKILTDCWCG